MKKKKYLIKLNIIRMRDEMWIQNICVYPMYCLIYICMLTFFLLYYLNYYYFNLNLYQLRSILTVFLYIIYYTYYLNNNYLIKTFTG